MSNTPSESTPLVASSNESNNDNNNNNNNNTAAGSSPPAFLKSVFSATNVREAAAAAASAHEPSSSSVPPPPMSLYDAVRSPATSRPTSRAPSPLPSSYNPNHTTNHGNDEIPTNVSTVEQLVGLPPECLSGDPVRPLRHLDEDGRVAHYALQPMLYSVFAILLTEGLERFSFYGINYTQTSYLTGNYNDDWNAGMDAIPASSYVSISVAVAYTTPFVGAVLADRWLGDYGAILTGAWLFYLPGVLLLALTTVPHGLLGDTFNETALAVGLLVLWPTGTGIVKSVVNVFGAKQFHPLLQSSLIEAYYVKFYMCINIGALVGGVLVPLLAQRNVTLAYFLPVGMLTVGMLLFVLGTPRYVRSPPKRRRPPPPHGRTTTAAILHHTLPTPDPVPLSVILRVSLLIVPFCIAYSQMATTFIVQGTVMTKAFGWIDAASMNNADAVAVLFFGTFIGNHVYPWLARHQIKIPTTYKFAIGSGLGALAIAWALVVEHRIKSTYATTGQQVSILWQALAYILIGAGEIFAVSAAYEVAFTASPPDKKVFCSALNLFCIGGIPNVICIALYQYCMPWFRNDRGTTQISHIADYAQAHVSHYFWVLLGISIAGALVNLLPAVRQFVESIEERATELIKTPQTPKRPPVREAETDDEDDDDDDADEEAALLKARRHQYYLKYGSGPQLYKHGSMRAGPALTNSQRSSDSATVATGSSRNGTNTTTAAQQQQQRPTLRRNLLSKLYGSTWRTPRIHRRKRGGKGSASTVAMPSPLVGADGRPVLAGHMGTPTATTLASSRGRHVRTNSLE